MTEGSARPPAQLPLVSTENQRALVDLVRELARLQLCGATGPPPARPIVPGPCGGAFVTFWRDDQLRGCVGTFASYLDIADAVVDAAHASLSDPRFQRTPITRDDLSTLIIEISVLSAPAKTHDPLSLIPGIHGVIIRHGDRSGCFLPRVAADRNWSADEFLSNCCRMKAGLPADAWKRPDVEVLLFTAQVISETGTTTLIPERTP